MKLQKYPELIQAPTIDGVLPLHEVCAHGHLDILQLLLHYSFPDHVMKTIKEYNGCRMYRLGFNVNAKDGHGRTPLHVACVNNHVNIVRELLSFKTLVILKHRESSFRMRKRIKSVNTNIASKRLSRSESGLRMFEDDDVTPGVSDKSEAVVTDADEASCDEAVSAEEYIQPVAVEVDSIDLDGNTPLHIAVKTGGRGPHAYHEITECLLRYGANANKPIISPSGNMSPLMCACVHENSRMVSLLLKYAAKDADNKALSQAISLQNIDVIGAFLRYRNRVDHATRVNTPRLYDLFQMSRHNVMSQSWCNATINMRHIWPSAAVILDWRALGLLTLDVTWLIDACKQHNKRRPKAELPLPLNDLALYAVTRIDVSDNQLTRLPLELFKLPSIRALTAANNHIKWVPGCAIDVPRSCSCLGNILRRRQSGAVNSTNSEQAANDVVPCGDTCAHVTANRQSTQALDDAWDCPLLEEINMQCNNLASIPRALCRLPLLRKLNLSSNKIATVPREMWKSTSLTELNLRHNLLQTLHTAPDSDSDSDSVGDVSTGVWSQASQGLGGGSVASDQTAVCLRLPGYKSGFRPIDVDYVEQWHDSLRVHDSSEHFRQKTTTSSKLTELNLSHNALASVPENLVCLTPYLETLNLSHNKITSFGAASLYPAALRELDLSHNRISDMLVDDLETSVDSGTFSLTSVCHSPHAKHKINPR